MGKEEELNKYLAEEIMGFNAQSHKGVYVEYYKNGKSQWIKENWNPLENLEQAFDVLEEYCNKNSYFWIIKNDEELNYWVDFSNPVMMQNERTIRNCGETKPKAIIGAILKAESKFEEFEEVFE